MWIYFCFKSVLHTRHRKGDRPTRLFQFLDRTSTMIVDTNIKKESDSHIPNRLFPRSHILFSHFLSESLAHFRHFIHSNSFEFMAVFSSFLIYSESIILNFNAMR